MSPSQAQMHPKWPLPHSKNTHIIISRLFLHSTWDKLQFSLGAIANVPLYALPAKVDRTLAAILCVTSPELKAAQGTSVRRLAGLHREGEGMKPIRVPPWEVWEITRPFWRVQTVSRISPRFRSLKVKMFSSPVPFEVDKYTSKKNGISGSNAFQLITDHPNAICKKLKSLSFCSCLQLTGCLSYQIPLNATWVQLQIQTGCVWPSKITITEIKIATFSAAQLLQNVLATFHPKKSRPRCAFSHPPYSYKKSMDLWG